MRSKKVIKSIYYPLPQDLRFSENMYKVER